MRRSIGPWAGAMMLLLAASPAAATTYRCTGSAGEPVFQQWPCGSTGAAVAAPGGTAGIGLRPSERAWLRDREAKARVPGSPKVRDASPRASAAQKAAAQAHRCRAKQRALDAVSDRLRRGYRPAQGDKLRQRRRAYQDYLDSFCS